MMPGNKNNWQIQRVIGGRTFLNENANRVLYGKTVCVNKSHSLRGLQRKRDRQNSTIEALACSVSHLKGAS